MTKKVSIKADVDTTTLSVSVIAVPGSAGTLVAFAGASSKVTISNTSTAGSLQYRVNAGSWVGLNRDDGIELAINLLTDMLYLRRSSYEGGAVLAQLIIDGAVAVAANYVRQASPAAGFMLLGNENFAAVTLASETIMDMQVPAISDFYAVRLKYANYNTAGTMTVDGAKVAPCPTHKTTAGNTLAWTGFVTFGGSQTGVVPQASIGPSGRIVPGVLLSDYVFVHSIARTDVVGAPFLLRIRSHLVAGAVVYTAGGVHSLPLNNAAFNPGLVYSNFNNAGGTLAQLTSNTFTTGDPSGAMEPVEVIFYYMNQVETLAVFGDSVMQGAGSETSNFAGFTTRATFLAFASGRRLSGVNFAQSGQTTYDSIATMKAHVLAGYRPTYIAIKPWSINDGTTAANIDASWAQFVEALEFLRTHDIIPVALTAPPTNGVAGAPWANIKVVNARVLALPGWIIKVDAANALNDVANDGNLQSIYDSGDHTHPKDAAHLLMAQLALAATAAQSVVGSVS